MSWGEIIAIVTLAGGFLFGLAKWVIGEMKQNITTLSTKVEKLTEALSALTPLQQHISAYDKLWANLTKLRDNQIRIQERLKLGALEDVEDE